jgi:peptidoglycan/xylan/chitin deacetylase (PgdA/CDA1 family)
MTIQLKRNDTKDTISYSLTYLDGSIVNLTGASVRFVMGNKKSLITDAPATIKNATTGAVEYTLTENDTLVAGAFHAEFEVTFADGKVKTFPNNGYILVNIQSNINSDISTYVEDQIANRVSDLQIWKNEIQAQLDQFAVGDSSPEIAQSRVEADGTTNTTLKARLDKKEAKFTQDIQSISSSLAENASQLIGNKTFKTITKPYLSFIFDDGNVETHTNALPIFEAEGVKGSIALPVNTTITPTAGRMTIAQLDEVYSKGWEFLGHGYQHLQILDTMTTDRVDFETDEARKMHNRLGYDVRGVVAPYGIVPTQYMQNFKNAYDFGFCNYSSDLVDTSKSVWELNRIDMRNKTLDTMKSHIDNAVANNKWLVLYEHFIGTTGYTTADTLQQVIQYAKSKGVEIKTPTEVMNEISTVFVQNESLNFHYSKVNYEGNLLKNHNFYGGTTPNFWSLVKSVTAGTITTTCKPDKPFPHYLVQFSGANNGASSALVQSIEYGFNFSSKAKLTIPMYSNGSNRNVSLEVKAFNGATYLYHVLNKTVEIYPNYKLYEFEFPIEKDSNITHLEVRITVQNIADSNQFDCRVGSPCLKVEYGQPNNMKHYTQVYVTAIQAVTNTGLTTSINFDKVSVDTTGQYDTVNKTYKVPEKGLYMVYVSLNVNGADTNIAVTPKLYLNGVSFRENKSVRTLTTAYTDVSLMAVSEFNKDDLLLIKMVAANTAPYNIERSSYFHIIQLA